MISTQWSRVIRVLLLAALPAAAFPLRADTASASSAITAALQPFVDRGARAGAVTLVADKDNVLSLNAVGYADLAAREPMRADTLFWIASQSKPITATALMLLVDEGKLSLDDSVAKYLPEFRNPWQVAEQDKDHLLLKRPQGTVTIRHLLSHTGGLPFRSEMEEPTLDLLRLRDAVRSYAMTPRGGPGLPSTPWASAAAPSTMPPAAASPASTRWATARARSTTPPAAAR
jgi:CubicO group peptidase (beta-lactamase class C family)